MKQALQLIAALLAVNILMFVTIGSANVVPLPYTTPAVTSQWATTNDGGSTATPPYKNFPLSWADEFNGNFLDTGKEASSVHVNRSNTDHAHQIAVSCIASLSVASLCSYTFSEPPTSCKLFQSLLFTFCQTGKWTVLSGNVGSGANGELQCYTDDNVHVNGGALVIEVG